jgi:uncharacterized protein with PQ loop repeat
MGAPLTSLGSVLRERSSQALSLSTSVTTFFNALAWILYGYFEAKADLLIIIPNAMGMCLAMIQLLLLWIFSN